MNPCPKCGSPNVGFATGTNFGCKCHACGHSNPAPSPARYANRAQAIAAWNKASNEARTAASPLFAPRASGGVIEAAPPGHTADAPAAGDGGVSSVRGSRGR